MTQRTKNSATESPKIERNALGGAFVAALALAISLPLQAGPDNESDKHHHNDVKDVEKQYSMDDPETPPKLRGSDGEDAVGSTHGNIETQYSMEDTRKGPKQSHRDGKSYEYGTHPDVDEKQVSMDETSPKLRDDRSGNERMMTRREGDNQHSQGAIEANRSFTSDEPADLSNWRGIAVYTFDENEFGEVDDVVVNLDTGNVTHLVIDNPGIREGTTLVSLNDVELRSEENRIAAKRDINQQRQRENLSERQRKSDSIIGSDVKGADGAQLGEIERLVIAPNTLNVYAILGNLDDEFELDLKASEVAVPLQALQMNQDNEFMIRLRARQVSDASPANVSESS